ncbi:hypothetical protein EJB05_01328, partial [Eragrostis curvula]
MSSLPCSAAAALRDARRVLVNKRRGARCGSGRTGPGQSLFRPGRFARYKEPTGARGSPKSATLGARFASPPRPTVDRRVPLAAGNHRHGREQEIAAAKSSALLPRPAGLGVLLPGTLPSPLILAFVTMSDAREEVAIGLWLLGCDSKMVCMAGHVKMASMLKLVMMENHGTTDEVINESSAAQILQKQLFDAHEPNFLDENDMHIFGSKPMTDPLDLVCCSTCKKPVKASQYAVHADKCSSGKVNTNDSMVEDHSGPTKPPKKGRKITLSSNGNQKIHIKMKAKSQSQCKDSANGFILENELASNVQPIDSTSDQRLKTSVDDAAAVSGTESCFRDAPFPLATKMYHSQGNCRLRLELSQLYRESQVEHLGSYTTPNSSQENGLMVSQFSPCVNPALLPVAQKNIVHQTKYLDQVPASPSESCSGIPQQLTASRSNYSKQAKAERVDTEASTFSNEISRTRCNRAAPTNSKSKGSKKAQQQPNGQHRHVSSPQ